MASRILLVDKDEYLLHVHSRYFECAGYEVDCATSEIGALIQVERKKYGAILFDLHVDNKNSNPSGLVFAAHVRKLQPRTLLFLLTSTISFEFERKAIASGVNKCLTKPQPLSELKKLVETTMEENLYRTGVDHLLYATVSLHQGAN